MRLILVILISVLLTSCVSYSHFVRAYNHCADSGVAQYSDAFEICLSSNGAGIEHFRFGG